LRILLTNDDGVSARGLVALAERLRDVGEVIVVAPERQQSATSHSATLHKPIRVHPAHVAEGVTAYACSGTPSDCVALGLANLAPGPVNLIVAGINHGRNLGMDVTYSGTAMAALEGCIKGVPSFAISVGPTEGKATQELEVEAAVEFAQWLCLWLAAHPLPPGIFLNVNVPALPPDQIRGLMVTRLGRLRYEDTLERRLDPWGRPYFWRGLLLKEQKEEADTDEYALDHDFISVTPLRADLTATAVFAELNQLNLAQQWAQRRTT
jgi:5'-nucleotidase